jgi:hypothetical protein
MKKARLGENASGRLKKLRMTDRLGIERLALL